MAFGREGKKRRKRRQLGATCYGFASHEERKKKGKENRGIQEGKKK